jgi:hypothetical protein
MAESMEKSPYFSREVNDWAASWAKRIYTAEIREMMLKWWKENQPYFQTGRYSEVRPGDPPPWAASPSSTPSPLSTTFLRETETPSPSQMPVASIAPLPLRVSSWGLLAAIVGLAIAAAGLVIYERTRK